MTLSLSWQHLSIEKTKRNLCTVIWYLSTVFGHLKFSSAFFLLMLCISRCILCKNYVGMKPWNKRKSGTLPLFDESNNFHQRFTLLTLCHPLLLHFDLCPTFSDGKFSLNCYMKLFCERQIWLNCFTRLVCLGPRRVFMNTTHCIVSYFNCKPESSFTLFASALSKRLL